MELSGPYTGSSNVCILPGVLKVSVGPDLYCLTAAITFNSFFGGKPALPIVGIKMLGCGGYTKTNTIGVTRQLFL
jgi:hypothetical protein